MLDKNFVVNDNACLSNIGTYLEIDKSDVAA